MSPMFEYARVACAGADRMMVPATGLCPLVTLQLNTNNQVNRQLVHSYLVWLSHER